MQHREYEFQKAVCRYISYKYPDVYFDSDTIASVKLTQQQAARNKAIQKKDFKRPDIAIYEPNNHYHGLFIELKIESPFKKDGTLKKNEHLEAQQKTIEKLNQKGYLALFCWTFEQVESVLNQYFSNLDVK